MWRKFYVIFVLNYVQGDGPLVETKLGLIRGLEESDMFMFLGIPYGRTNEANPFGLAEPYPKFDSTYEAYNDPPACPQMLYGVYIGSLDCLRLNVFSPSNISNGTKLPVIVWIYGGAYTRGFTTKNYYGTSNIVKYGVIVVTLNYRVGPYGFMCLHTREVCGNQGIKDQVLAMRWVKDNIASFGGDNDKITLMGESSGAANIDVHLLSRGDDLYNQVIMQSGSVLKPTIIMESDANVPLLIAAKLGFKTDNASKAVTFLATEEPKSVIEAVAKLPIKLGICIEKEFDGVKNVLTDTPYNLDKPRVKGMNILAGYNNREGLVMNAIDPFEYIQNPYYFRNSLKTVFEYDDGFKTMEDIVRHFYIGDAELTERVRSKILDFQSDFFYNFPLQSSLSRFLANGVGNIYQYMFSYEGNLNYIKIERNISLGGACHGDELGYLFQFRGNGRVPSEEDSLIIKRVTTLWTNFVKYGNPLPEPTEFFPFTWKPITEDAIPYMNIDLEVTMKTRPFNDRLAFWKLFFIANRHRLKGYKERDLSDIKK